MSKYFGGNDDVQSAPIWEIAKRSNEQLPINAKTGKPYTPVTRNQSANDRYFSGC